eukprot:m.343956 g.343956  ORF g.343956 m.343956 type:complete len:235 (-) comp23630_c0_seq1:7-711(-)
MRQAEVLRDGVRSGLRTTASFLLFEGFPRSVAIGATTGLISALVTKVFAVYDDKAPSVASIGAKSFLQPTVEALTTLLGFRVVPILSLAYIPYALLKQDWSTAEIPALEDGDGEEILAYSDSPPLPPDDDDPDNEEKKKKKRKPCKCKWSDEKNLKKLLRIFKNRFPDLTEKELGNAIHEFKEEMIMGIGKTRNPDVRFNITGQCSRNCSFGNASVATGNNYEIIGNICHYLKQ